MRSSTTKVLSSLLATLLATPTVWAEIYQHAPTTPIPPVTAAPIAANPTTVPVPTTTPSVPTATNPQVSRATFTTTLLAREPTDSITRIAAGQQVHYFTELVGLQGRVINHRWERDGTFQLGLQFPVTGSPWRVHSSKTISPNLPGTWTVTVQNDDGTVLRRDTLIVDPAVPNTALAPVASPTTPNATPAPMTPPTTPNATPVPIANTPAAPVIPPPAQPLTTIPKDQQRPPANRPETNDKANPSAITPNKADNGITPNNGDSKRPIWETLPR